ncbi:MAG: hypothetical protein VX642_11365 [Bdellovibrionota bacterium]|nr:hypothetical protein [Bdellovibrionota bacterium]
MKHYLKILISAISFLSLIAAPNASASQWACKYSSAKNKIQNLLSSFRKPTKVSEVPAIDEQTRKYELLVDAYSKIENGKINSFLYSQFTKSLKEFYGEFGEQYKSSRLLISQIISDAQSKNESLNKNSKFSVSIAKENPSPQTSLLFFEGTLEKINKNIKLWESPNKKWALSTQEAGKYHLEADRLHSREVKIDFRFGNPRIWNDLVLISTGTFSTDLFYYENSQIKQIKLGEIIRIEENWIQIIDRSKYSEVFSILTIHDGIPKIEPLNGAPQLNSHLTVNKIGESKFIVNPPDMNGKKDFYQTESKNSTDWVSKERFDLVSELRTVWPTKAFVRSNEAEIELYHLVNGSYHEEILPLTAGKKFLNLLKVDDNNFLAGKYDFTSSFVYHEEYISWYQRNSNGSLVLKKDFDYLAEIQVSNSLLIGKNKSNQWVSYDFQQNGRKRRLGLKGSLKLKYPYLVQIDNGFLSLYKISDNRKSFQRLGKTEFLIHDSRVSIESLDDRFFFIIPRQEPHFYFYDLQTNTFEVFKSDSINVFRGFKFVENSNKKFIWGLATNGSLAVTVLSLDMAPVLATEIHTKFYRDHQLYQHLESSSAKITPEGIEIGGNVLLPAIKAEKGFE